MRPHAILLLLLGSLAVAARDAFPTFPSLLCNSKELSEVPILLASKATLFCANSNEEIEYARKRFNQLDCNAGKWTHKGAPLTPPLPDGLDILNYRCAAKHSPVSDDVYVCNTVEHLKNGRTTTTYGVPRLVCSNTNEEIEYAQQRFEQLDCLGKWTEGNMPLTPPPTEHSGLHYRCVAKAPAVADEAPTCKVDAGGTLTTVIGRVLKCSADDEVLEYKQQRFPQIECDNGEWKHDNSPLSPLDPTVSRLYIRCVPIGSAPGTYTPESESPTPKTNLDPITTMLEQVMQYSMQYKGVFLIVLAIAAIFCCYSSWFKEEEQSKKNDGMSDSNMDEV